MKNSNKVLLSLFIAGMSFSTVFAQMDNLINLSSEWVRSGARNASADAADAVVYNPAGVVQLEDGFHIHFSNQSMFRNPSHSYDLGIGQGPRSFSQSGADPFLPNLYAAYKKNNWALYTGAFISGGGATMNYPEGSLITDLIGLQSLMATEGAYTDIKAANLKASSMYLTTTLGGSYQASTRFSMSLALRHITAKNTAKAGITLTTSPLDLPDMPLALETEESASGIGAVIGINFTAATGLNLSSRYESAVALDFKTKQLVDDFGMTKDGDMARRDLPAVFAVGVSYDVNEKLQVLADYNYYFQKNADWGTSTPVTEEKSWSSMAGDAATIAAGLQYKVSNSFTYSFGGGYTNFAYSDREGYYTRIGTYEVMMDDNWNLNTGFAFQATEKLNFSFGYMHAFWAKDQKIKALNAQPLDVDVTVNNSMDIVAFGVNFRF